jgi:hypothetical protein
MIGYAQTAGNHLMRIRSDAGVISEYFSVPSDRLKRALESIETEEKPRIILLQNMGANANIGAATFFSSVWSKAYGNLGTPYGKVHRDFHYQCLFVAIAALVEAGCEHIRVENPMSGYRWREDAYICLMEAFRNIQKNMNRRVSVYLEQGSYNERLVERLDRNQPDFDMQEHRPVGICMHMFEGLNMRTVFIEKAQSSKATQ